MDFEWDESKREGNISKHGIDFAETIAVLPQAVLAPARTVGGEQRNMAIIELQETW